MCEKYKFLKPVVNFSMNIVHAMETCPFPSSCLMNKLSKVPLLFCLLLPFAFACRAPAPEDASCIYMRGCEVLTKFCQYLTTWDDNVRVRRHKCCCLMAAPRWQRPIIRDETWVTQKRHIVWDSPSPKARCVLHSLAHAKTVWQKRFKIRAERGS